MYGIPSAVHACHSVRSLTVCSGSHTLKWRYVKDGSGSAGADCGWVDWVQHPNSEPSPPNTLAEAMDCDLNFTTGGDAQWSRSSMEPYYDHDCAESDSINDDEQTWMQTTVDVNAQEQETVTFYWRVSSEEGYDYLQFYIDGVLKDQISGYVDWQLKSYTLSSGSHTLKWRYVKDGSEYSGSDCGWVDWVRGPGEAPPEPPGPLAEALDCDLSFGTDGHDPWFSQSSTWYYDGDAARSDHIASGKSTMAASVDGEGRVSFYWKVSSLQNDDYLRFYIDGVLKDQISGEVDWHKKSYNVTGSGIHTLEWSYDKDYSGSAGEDRGWVDLVQWTGTSPPQDPNNWDKISYKYDPSGRRIKKTVDGYKTTYCYDGDHVIAEYDGNGNLLRKYVYGPRVDEPVCMIEVAAPPSVAHWKLDEGSGTTAYDSAGSNDGTIYGATWTTGKLGNALDFDGNGDYVDLPYGSGIDPSTSPHTFSMWVKSDEPSASQVFFSSGSGTNDRMYLGTHDTDWEMGIYDDSWGEGTTTATSDWTHISLVMNGTDAIMYVNGNEDHIKDYASYTFNQNIDIGRQPTSPGTYDFNGKIDDVRIYDRALSADEIEQLYDQGHSGPTYYFYHFDGLGSVVALSDSAGDTVQTYEYSVYGQVAASDPNHPNPYLFTGRRFDRETGLYYYRARYYNPYIGRFMQTDPVGYSDGMNWYLYCRNNPLAWVDPSGRLSIAKVFNINITDEEEEENSNDIVVGFWSTPEEYDYLDEDLRENVDQWDFFYDVSSMAQLVGYLKELSDEGYNIVGVYIHGWTEYKEEDAEGIVASGIYIGENVYNAYDIGRYSAEIADYTDSSCVFHWRYSGIANVAGDDNYGKGSLLYNIAGAINRTCTGPVSYIIDYGPDDVPPEEEINPSYHFTGMMSRVFKDESGVWQVQSWDASTDWYW